MVDKKAAKAAKFRVLQGTFTAQLPDRLATMRQVWIETQAHTDNAAPRQEFQRQVHSLAGSAGTFGYSRLGERARQVEDLLLQFAEEAFNDADTTKAIVTGLEELEAIASRGADTVSDYASVTVQPVATAARDKPLLYVLEDDALLSLEIVAQLENFGYEVAAFPAVQQIIEAQNKQPADAFILDIILPEGSLHGPEIAPRLQALGTHHVPLIFISSRDDWEARLAALRAGGRAYFQKPLDFTVLVEQLDQLLGRQEHKAHRVLIVDDNVILAEHYAAVLHGAGMETNTINDPTRLIETLSEFQPDIVIMDLHMPQCSGSEAAQIIRQHDLYQSLPIVFLATESALQQQLNALRLDGDNILQKPIRDDHLVEAVTIRAERFCGLKTLMTCDSLTGLLNHINLKLALEREISLAKRRGGQVTFVMLDIDHFKSINDRYGHPQGDRVIKSLARLLVQRMRKTDIVARYGGEEFAVILPDTDADAAFTLLDDLRKRFAEITYTHENDAFNATFSAGIASCPPHLEMDNIVKVADSALYEAKQAGRNRVNQDNSAG